MPLPSTWVRGMPTFWVFGDTILSFKDHLKPIRLTQGPFVSYDEALRQGTRLYGTDFTIWKSFSLDMARVKAEYRSSLLRKTASIQDSIQPIYGKRKAE